MLEQTTPTSADIVVEDAALEVPVIVPGDDEPTLMLPDPLPPRRKPRFFRGLCLYFVIVLAVILVGLWFFYSYLAKREAATPNAALQRYMDWVIAGDYESIYQTSGFEESLINNKESYLRYLETLYKDASDLTVRQQVTTDTEVTRYSLYSGSKRLSTLLLARSAEGDGTAWYVTTDLAQQPTYTVTAAEDVRLTINGVDVSLLSLPSAEVQSEVFPTAEGATVTTPTVRRYTLDNLLTPPTVAALTLGGEDCTVVTEGESIYVFSPETADDRTTHEQLAVEAAKTYAKFVAKDASRTQLLKIIHKDSQLYQTIRNFSNVWFNKHESYEFRNVEFAKYTRYTADDFSCVVSFQPIYMRNGKPIQSTPVCYRMTFLRVEGEWTLYALTQTTREEAGLSSATTATTSTTASAATTTTTGS